jgi:hypothetical protein
MPLSISFKNTPECRLRLKSTVSTIGFLVLVRPQDGSPLALGGVTVMFAYLPAHLKEYSIMQVSISNGSPISWTVKPEDFSYRQQDGTVPGKPRPRSPS